MPFKCRYCDQMWRDLEIITYIVVYEHLEEKHPGTWDRVWEKIKPMVVRAQPTHKGK